MKYSLNNHNDTTQERAAMVRGIREMFPIIKAIGKLETCYNSININDSKGVPMAHAHNGIQYEDFGRICVADDSLLLEKNGKPSQVLLHEVAHLMVAEIDECIGHGEEWGLQYNTLRYDWGYEWLDNPTTYD